MLTEISLKRDSYMVIQGSRRKALCLRDSNTCHLAETPDHQCILHMDQMDPMTGHIVFVKSVDLIADQTKHREFSWLLALLRVRADGGTMSNWGNKALPTDSG